MSIATLKNSLLALVALGTMVPTAASAALTFLVGNQNTPSLTRATVNGNTVSVTTLDSTTQRYINGMALDASNNVWFVGGTDTAPVVGTLDPTTGATISQTILTNSGYGILGMSFAPNGTLYAIRDEPSGVNSFGTLDTTTGNFSLIGYEQFADDIAFVGSTLYSIDRNKGLCTINTTTGAVTDVNTSVGGNGERGMTYYNGVMYLTKTGIETVNLSTGAITPIGTDAELGSLQGGIVVDPVPVPEPASLGLIGVGTIALLARRRRPNLAH